jgi:hypothetical protein
MNLNVVICGHASWMPAHISVLFVKVSLLEMAFLSQVEGRPGRGPSLVNIGDADCRTATFSIWVNIYMVIQHSSHRYPNFLLHDFLKLILCEDHNSVPWLFMHSSLAVVCKDWGKPWKTDSAHPVTSHDLNQQPYNISLMLSPVLTLVGSHVELPSIKIYNLLP